MTPKEHLDQFLQNQAVSIKSGTLYLALHTNKAIQKQHKKHKAVVKHTIKQPIMNKPITGSMAVPDMKRDCLIQTTSGTIEVRSASSLAGASDVEAILLFPTGYTSFCLYEVAPDFIDKELLRTGKYVEGSHGKGLFENMTSLKFISRIPDGVTDLQIAFRGCTSLNCDIYLPQSATYFPDMLEDCINFSSHIHCTEAQATKNKQYSNYYIIGAQNANI